MAWLSAGTSNADLISQLVTNGVIRDERIRAAFELTDRGDFVPPSQRSEAYNDRPFKNGYTHLSAPHIYATVLQNLKLQRGHTFLNVGSGSGYLSCLAACLVEDIGLSHGIEICVRSIEKCRLNCDTWRKSVRDNTLLLDSSNYNRLLLNHDGNSKLINAECLQFVVGNCFNIDIKKASTQLYDRIYVGASCPETCKNFFFHLLAEKGILILPISESKQLTIICKSSLGYTIERLSNVHFNELIIDTQEINPTSKISLPRLLWIPTKDRHQLFSDSFRVGTKTLLLSISRSFDQIRVKLESQSGKVIKKRVVLLPSHIWIYIITFMARDWFLSFPRDQVSLELQMERNLRVKIEVELSEAINETVILREFIGDVFPTLPPGTLNRADLQRYSSSSSFLNYLFQHIDSINNDI